MRVNWTRLFRQPKRRKAAPPHPQNLPGNADEVLAMFGRWAAIHGVPCKPGRDFLLVLLPGHEVKVSATELLFPAFRPPGPPPSHESDAEFLARQHREAADQKARLARAYPLDGDGRPAWSPLRGLREVERAERDEVLDAAMRDEAY